MFSGVHTYDNYLQVAFRSLRHLLKQDGDVFTDVDRSLSYDLIEELRERYAVTRLRPGSDKTGERSNFEGDAGSAGVHRGNV